MESWLCVCIMDSIFPWILVWLGLGNVSLPHMLCSLELSDECIMVNHLFIVLHSSWNYVWMMSTICLINWRIRCFHSNTVVMLYSENANYNASKTKVAQTVQYLLGFLVLFNGFPQEEKSQICLASAISLCSIAIKLIATCPAVWNSLWSTVIAWRQLEIFHAGEV